MRDPLRRLHELAAHPRVRRGDHRGAFVAAGQLAEAADKLTGAIKSFRLLADEITTQQAAD